MDCTLMGQHSSNRCAQYKHKENVGVSNVSRTGGDLESVK